MEQFHFSYPAKRKVPAAVFLRLQQAVEASEV
jgi:hypothetical protein